MAGGAQEKTEQATPKRLADARRKGQVSRSTDLTGALCLLSMVTLLYAIKDRFFSDLQRYLTSCFNRVGNVNAAEYNLLFYLNEAVIFFLKILAPFLGVALLVAIASNLFQVGFLFTTEALRPNLAVFNPLLGLQRMFSRRSMVELAKSVLKITIIGSVTFQLIRNNLKDLLLLFNSPPWGIYQVVIGFVLKVALWGALAYLVLSLLDYMYQRYEYNKSLMMSKQEVKDEFKQMEGDQLIKSRRREFHRSISINQIIKEVPRATVVVTNPTHLAVALRYEQGKMAAPRLVAKGAGRLAVRIKEIARENGVPVMENKEVAQFIYWNVDIDQEIPLEIYQAVAQILVMVYRLKAKENYRPF